MLGEPDAAGEAAGEIEGDECTDAGEDATPAGPAAGDGWRLKAAIDLASRTEWLLQIGWCVRRSPATVSHVGEPPMSRSQTPP